MPIRSKKTQRDKDWFMLKRLIENDIIINKENPSKEKIKWWFRECRDAETLIELTKIYPKVSKECIVDRKLLVSARKKDTQKLNSQLHEEELAERQKDIKYWAPLKKELETLRHRKKN